MKRTRCYNEVGKPPGFDWEAHSEVRAARVALMLRDSFTSYNFSHYIYLPENDVMCVTEDQQISFVLVSQNGTYAAALPRATPALHRAPNQIALMETKTARAASEARPRTELQTCIFCNTLKTNGNGNECNANNATPRRTQQRFATQSSRASAPTPVPANENAKRAQGCDRVRSRSGLGSDSIPISLRARVRERTHAARRRGPEARSWAPVPWVVGGVAKRRQVV